MDEVREESREALLALAISHLGDAQFAQRLADFLWHCSGYDNFIVIAYAGHGSPVSLFQEARDPRVYQAFDSEYVRAAYILDPFYRLHMKKAQVGLYRLQDIAPDQFTRTRYFEQYYRQTTLRDETAMLAYTRSGLTITACMGKDHTSENVFSRAALSTLKRYAPVVIALIEQHWAELHAGWEQASTKQQPVLGQLIELFQSRNGTALTPRQAEVALLILQGHSSKSIAAMLDISPQTVKVFRKQLYARCEISSQAELFALMMPIVADISSAAAGVIQARR